MKKNTLFSILFLFFAFVLSTNAQEVKNSSYEELWKEADSLFRIQLPETGLKTIVKIYDKSKKEKKYGHFIKAKIYQMTYASQKEENAIQISIENLKKELQTADDIVKPVLESMIAEVYWKYYQQNQWQISQRTKTEGTQTENLATWDLQKIADETAKYYLLSLQNEDVLQKTKLDIYDEIIQSKTEKGRNFRPTLYDFLAHRAIDFFSNTRLSLTKPSYEFTLDSKDYFTDNQTFSQLKINSKDSASYKLQALQLLQKVIAFHLNDPNHDALVDVDLKRFNFVNQHSTLESTEKGNLLLTAYQNLEKKYIKEPVSTRLTYKIAKFYYGKSQKTNPKTRFNKAKALEICQTAIERFPESEGAKNCKALESQIKQKSFSFELEKSNIPNVAILATLKYQNVKKLYAKIVRFKEGDFKKIEVLYKQKDNKQTQNELKVFFFNQKESIETWNLDLPSVQDYQQYTTHIAIPKLKLGSYILLLSTNSDFSTLENATALSEIQVTDISYVSRDIPLKGKEFLVLSRSTGKPLAGVNVEVTETNYYGGKKGNRSTYTSDKKGYFTIPHRQGNYNNLKFTYRKDTYSPNQIYIQGKDRRNHTNSTINIHLFTDRAIYRPGQTVYFKGIAIRTDTDDNKEILSDYKQEVTFKDVNYQEIDKMTLTTNEYGTFSGSFQAPVGKLTGQMHISTPKGSVFFRVEEYKRPNFEVKFNELEGEQKLGEKVTAKGFAKTYSGANLSDAKVSYRVVREVRSWWNSSPDVEIAKGEVQTNEKGEFEIIFDALPDKSIPKSDKPTFTYAIYADVSDITGETHSAEQSISLAYHSLEISLAIADELDKSKTNKFKIKTTNIAGKPISAKGNLQIYAIKHNPRTFRQGMINSATDTVIYSKEEFYKAFPHDVYQEENEARNWGKGKQVFKTDFDTKTNTDLEIKNLTNWKSGIYLVKMQAKDKNNEDITFEKKFTIWSPKDTKLGIPSYFKINKIKTTGEPKQNAEIQLGTSENIQVLMEVEHDGKIIRKEWINLKDKTRNITFPILEKYRGGFAVNFTSVKDNRLHKENIFVNVPYTNKELDISFETFRNKLLPAQKEEWKIKIKGKKGDKVAAEMMATLYDASLDEFANHTWNLNLYNNYNSSLAWGTQGGVFGLKKYSTLVNTDWNSRYNFTNFSKYEKLNWFHTRFNKGVGVMMYATRSRSGEVEEEMMDMDMGFGAEEEDDSWGDDGGGDTVVRTTADGQLLTGLDDEKSQNFEDMDDLNPLDFYDAKKPDLSKVKARTNLSELAFFYPQLQTDAEGSLIIKFTMPEALTRWKLLTLAHTKDLKVGFTQKELITQKELMLVPNVPRFLRQGDKVRFAAKVSNLSDKGLNGNAKLYLFDALTMKPVDVAFANSNAERKFELKKGGNTALFWELEVPENIQALTYRVVAQAGDFSDGQEAALPILSNRMLVTESMPLSIRGNQTKDFKLKKLAKSGKSKTLRQHKLTLEFTSNPLWYAVQAMPYLMEYPHECAEQTFSRYYANTIASHLVDSNPVISRVYNSWKTLEPAALLSNLEKNQELKSLLLEETPWVLAGKSETQNKKRLALLFDVNKMSNELDIALDKLSKKQKANGAWAWFDGMQDNRYITQHIVAGLGKINHLDIKQNSKANQMAQKGVSYLDRQIKKDYEELEDWAKRDSTFKFEDQHIGYNQIHYLYTRSFFKSQTVPSNSQKAFDYYLGQTEKYWAQFNQYSQGLIALTLHRHGKTETANLIVKSLKEKSLQSEELGMYWKQNAGYYWYQMPIETQALMIEVFGEVANDQNSVEELKIWLLKNKQTNDWKTTKATAEAVYALLKGSEGQLGNDPQVEITVGNEKINIDQTYGVVAESGTGYFKTSWTGSEIKPEMANVHIEKKDKGIAWGALYWQYFEQLDKITGAETPLKLKKQLFLQKKTDKGIVLTPITEKNKLEVGQKITVRILLQVDREMEYIHLKDMRAAAFEPVNTLSGYRYQDGLGYYQSTKDASTNFFISYLSKGNYVFEYELQVNQTGNFSNGISTIQSMYAPEFSSHSEGIRVEIEE